MGLYRGQSAAGVDDQVRADRRDRGAVASGADDHQRSGEIFQCLRNPEHEVLADAKTIYAEVKRPKGASVHILTGPIYVEGAEPGDTLEVRVLDIKFRVPYGVNNTGPGKGVLPKLLKEPAAKLIRIDLETTRGAIFR